MRMVVSLILLAAACSPKKAAPPPAPSEPIVARVGDESITARELSEQLAKQPPAVRAHYTSPQRRKDFLENQIRFELLAGEARRRGFDKDPDFERAMKQQLVSTYLQKEMEARLKPADIPDAEVEKYYREHSAEFNQPELARVSQIVVKDRNKARKLVAEVKKLAPDDVAGFAKIVAAHSEDPDSKTRGGDLGFFERDKSAHPKPVVEAVFALQKPGDVAGPIQTDRGFHLVRLVQRRPGSARTYAEASGDIRQRLYQQQRARRMDELLASIKQRTKVEIYEAELGKVVIDTPPAIARP